MKSIIDQCSIILFLLGFHQGSYTLYFGKFAFGEWHDAVYMNIQQYFFSKRRKRQIQNKTKKPPSPSVPADSWTLSGSVWYLEIYNPNQEPWRKSEDDRHSGNTSQRNWQRTKFKWTMSDRVNDFQVFVDKDLAARVLKG